VWASVLGERSSYQKGFRNRHLNRHQTIEAKSPNRIRALFHWGDAGFEPVTPLLGKLAAGLARSATLFATSRKGIARANALYTFL
jgi:hypothetical protein